MKPAMLGLIVFVVMLSVVAALYWYLTMSYKVTVSATVTGISVTITPGTSDKCTVLIVPSGSMLTRVKTVASGGGSVIFEGVLADTYTAVVISSDLSKILGTTTFTVGSSTTTQLAPQAQAPTQAPTQAPSFVPQAQAPTFVPGPARAPGPA